MRYQYLYIIIIATFCSCGEWLDVQPEDQTSEEQLYAKCEGYYNQLNGLYKKCAEPGMYGKELSWGLIDVLAQYYDLDHYTTSCKNYAYRQAADFNYEYERTKPLIAAFWEQGYNIIANCNNLIENTIKADSSLFPETEKERKLILGEAYAMRALMHFDLLRLFAPHISKDREGKYIPYIHSFPTHIPTKETNSNVLNNVIDDLQKAYTLTESYDTLYSGNIGNLGRRLELRGDGKGDKRFLNYRGYRLHHYAIIGLLARVYLYMEDYDNALLYAQKLTTIHAQKRWFNFTTSTYDVTRYGNIKLYGDVIFAFYNNKATDYEKLESPSDDIYISIQDYWGIFNVDESRDIRHYQWGLSQDGKNIPLKFKWQQEENTEGEVSNKMLPMIRLSEMYYIAAECLYRKQEKERAYQFLNYVRNQRKITKEIPETSTIDEFLIHIENDMRRELYGEGQLFFFYKRLNRPIPTFDSNKLTLDKEFILPIPESNNL